MPSCQFQCSTVLHNSYNLISTDGAPKFPEELHYHGLTKELLVRAYHEVSEGHCEVCGVYQGMC